MGQQTIYYKVPHYHNFNTHAVARIKSTFEDNFTHEYNALPHNLELPTAYCLVGKRVDTILERVEHLENASLCIQHFHPPKVKLMIDGST